MSLATAYWLLTRYGPDNATALLILLVVIGLIAGVTRGFTGPDAKTARGRLRAAAWNVALVVLSVALPTALQWSSWAAVTIPAIAAGIVIFRPRAVRSAVAVGLVALSLVGFNAVRTAEFGYSQERDRLRTDPGRQSEPLLLLVLPQAYAVPAARQLVKWRSASRCAARGSCCGRLAQPESPAGPGLCCCCR